MKRLIFIALCMVGILSGCDDFYYMPFKETDNGRGKLSLYLDGKPYCSQEPTYNNNGSNGTVSSSLSEFQFSLYGKCGPEGTYGYDNISIDIRIDSTSRFESGQEYYITRHPSLDNADGTPAEGPSSYVYISFNGRYAEKGSITFRKMEDGVASGNFEFDFKDFEGVSHTIRYGNFDSAPRIIY